MLIHLRDSLVPLSQGSDTVANCGAVVPQATALRLAEDGSVAASGLNRICGRCQAVRATERRYFYALLPGQLGLEQERGSAA